MYTYLRNIGPHFFMVSFFLLKVVVLVVNFDGFSTFSYSSYILWFWPLGRVWCRHTSLSSNLYLKGCQFCPTFSLEKGIIEQALPCAFGLPPSLIMPPKCSNWVYFGVRLCEGKFGFFVQWNAFMQNFWNFQVIPTTKIILTLVQNKLILKNSSDSYWQVS
jgi:hypothetical protein